jgi:hypothetical protein
MPNLNRRTTPTPDQLLNAAVLATERAAVASVARLQAGAFVSSVAMQNACLLSQAANSAFHVSPMAESIYQSIVMAYGSLAVMEIQKLSFSGRLS